MMKTSVKWTSTASTASTVDVQRRPEELCGRRRPVEKRQDGRRRPVEKLSLVDVDKKYL